MRQKQRTDKKERCGESDIPDPTDFPAGLFRDFVGQEIQDHRRPARIAAPSAPEDQRSEDLGYGVMNRRCLEDAREQVIPEALDLHVFPTDQAEIDQHIQTDEQLYDAPGVRIIPDKEKHPQGHGTPDIAEVKKVKNVAFGDPQYDGDRLEDDQHENGRGVFFHCKFLK